MKKKEPGFGRVIANINEQFKYKVSLGISYAFNCRQELFLVKIKKKQRRICGILRLAN